MKASSKRHELPSKLPAWRREWSGFQSAIARSTWLKTTGVDKVDDHSTSRTPAHHSHIRPRHRAQVRALALRACQAAWSVRAASLSGAGHGGRRPKLIHHVLHRVLRPAPRVPLPDDQGWSMTEMWVGPNDGYQVSGEIYASCPNCQQIAVSMSHATRS
jgi:hypothetical protein